jgi:hypothetical protein
LQRQASRSDIKVPYSTTHLSIVTCMLGLPCGSTNGCTLNRYGSALVRRLAKPGPAVYRLPPASEPLTPLPATWPAVQTLSSHAQHLNLKYETVSHQWGIPAAIFTIHGMYTLQVWPVNPPPRHARLHG